jgi:hypothetical protein
MQALGRERLALQPKLEAQLLVQLCDARSSACIGKCREDFPAFLGLPWN